MPVKDSGAGRYAFFKRNRVVQAMLLLAPFAIVWLSYWHFYGFEHDYLPGLGPVDCIVVEHNVNNAPGAWIEVGVITNDQELKRIEEFFHKGSSKLVWVKQLNYQVILYSADQKRHIVFSPNYYRSGEHVDWIRPDILSLLMHAPHGAP